MSFEGSPANKKTDASKLESGDALKPDIFDGPSLAAAVTAEAGGKAEWWSPDYYELVDETGVPLRDEAGKHVIVELGQMTVGGQASVMMKIPVTEPPGHGRKKGEREMAVIRDIAALAGLVPGKAVAGARKLQQLSIERTPPGQQGAEKHIERVEPRELGSVQRKIVAFLLSKEISAKTIEGVLATGAFGPHLSKDELEELLPSERGTQRYIEQHSYIDIPASVRHAAMEAVKAARQPEEASSAEQHAAPVITEPPQKHGLESRASQYARSEQYIRDLMGDPDDERWKEAKKAVVELRKEVGSLQWFTFGANTADVEKRGNYSQLVLAPRDAAHERALTDILEHLNIQPWPELQGNTPTLIIEYRRDIELLRAVMIFDHLLMIQGQEERERLLRQAQERMARVQEWLAGKRREEAAQRDQGQAEARARQEAEQAKSRERQQEQERLMRIDMEARDFREKKKGEKARLVAEFFAAIPEPKEEEFARPFRAPQDHYFRFNYPNTPQVRERGRRKKPVETAFEPLEPEEVDQQLEEIQEAFQKGLINEETLGNEFGIRAEATGGPQAPNLMLFPQKYVWEQNNPRRPGLLRERGTGRLLNQSDVLDAVIEARTGPPGQYEKSIRELILMNRTLILWKFRQVKERHPSADPDELFQAGIKGLAYAVEHFEMRPDTSFNSYFIPVMEGYMRHAAQNARFRAVYVPSHVSEMRKKVIDAERALQTPDGPVRRQDVALSLQDQGVIGGSANEADIAFDRYVRKALYAYEEAEASALDDETVTADDVDMLGRALYEDPLAADPAEAAEAQAKISSMLQTLTPREEATLRAYFEIYGSNEKVSSDIYRSLSEQLASEGIALSSEDAKQKIHELTGYGDLNSEAVLAGLPAQDRTIALRYGELLREHAKDATLDDVGERLSVTRERVRQIMIRAIRKLRHPGRSKYLKHL